MSDAVALSMSSLETTHPHPMNIQHALWKKTFPNNPFDGYVWFLEGIKHHDILLDHRWKCDQHNPSSSRLDRVKLIKYETLFNIKQRDQLKNVLWGGTWCLNASNMSGKKLPAGFRKTSQHRVLFNTLCSSLVHLRDQSAWSTDTNLEQRRCCTRLLQSGIKMLLNTACLLVCVYQ